MEWEKKRKGKTPEMKYRSPWTVIVISFFFLALVGVNILAFTANLTSCPACHLMGEIDCYQHHDLWSYRKCLTLFTMITFLVTPVLILGFALILIFVWRMDEKDQSYRFCWRVAPCCLVSEQTIDKQVEFHKRCAYGQSQDNQTYIYTP